MVRFLAPLGASIIYLIISILKSESFLRARKHLHNENPEDGRAWRYRTDLIAWAIFTIVIFAIFIFKYKG